MCKSTYIRTTMSSYVVVTPTTTWRRRTSIFLTRCCCTVNEFIYDVSSIYLLTYDDERVSKQVYSWNIVYELDHRQNVTLERVIYVVVRLSVTRTSSSRRRRTTFWRRRDDDVRRCRHDVVRRRHDDDVRVSFLHAVVVRWTCLYTMFHVSTCLLTTTNVSC